MDIRRTIPLQQARSAEEVRTEQLGKLKQAAKMYEQQFLGEMVKAMRATVQKSDLIPETMGERIFKDKIDQEYVQGWSERGGVGMADMIYTQLKERYFPEKLTKLGPIAGPLPLNQGEGTARFKGTAQEGEAKGPIEIELKPDPLAPQNETKATPDQSRVSESQNLLAPWAGKVMYSQAHDDGTKSVILDHGEGVRSELKHTGSLKSFEVGQAVQAGEILGDVKGSDPTVKWNLWT